jgi:hypothetical protein
VFASARYGYSVRLPGGWYVREIGAGAWTLDDLDYVGAGTDSFEEDYAGRGTTASDFPGVTYGLYVSSEKAAPGMTLPRWTDALAETMARDSSCQGAPDRTTTTVAGEPASLLVYDRRDCEHDHHLLLIGVLHRGSGFAIMWLARRGEDDVRRADFDAVMRSFTFAP